MQTENIWLDIADAEVEAPRDVLILAGGGSQDDNAAAIVEAYPALVAEVAALPGLRSWLQSWNIGDGEGEDYCETLDDHTAVMFALWIAASDVAEREFLDGAE